MEFTRYQVKLREIIEHDYSQYNSTKDVMTGIYNALLLNIPKERWNDRIEFSALMQHAVNAYERSC